MKWRGGGSEQERALGTAGARLRAGPGRRLGGALVPQAAGRLLAVGSGVVCGEVAVPLREPGCPSFAAG